MIAEYEVSITETSYGLARVKADSEDEAREKACEVYSNGNVNWGKLDYETCGVKKIGGDGGHGT